MGAHTADPAVTDNDLPDEMQRIRAVFERLDQDGDHFLSHTEFNVLSTMCFGEVRALFVDPLHALSRAATLSASHSLTQPLTHSASHSLSLSLTQPLNQPLTQPLTHTATQRKNCKNSPQEMILTTICLCIVSDSSYSHPHTHSLSLVLVVMIKSGTQDQDFSC